MAISRREMLMCPAALAAGLAVGRLAKGAAAETTGAEAAEGATGAEATEGMTGAEAAEGMKGAEAAADGVKEASWWEALDAKRVRCTLCPRKCEVADMERGYCGVRENRGGKYYTLVYGRPCAINVDPVEKKPLFHFLPGTKAYSIGTAGCNMECVFCQNWNISQFRPEQVDSVKLPPDHVIKKAEDAGCSSVAFTYNEPVIFAEYARDTAALGREAGMPCVMISNGYIEREPMKELCGSLGAVKVDLKAFTEEFYKERCHGTLEPVKETLKVLSGEGIWFEIVVLLVTGLNDSVDEVKRMSAWIVKELGADVPLHFSRYFPFYKLQLPQTPIETMKKAYEAAKSEGVNFVYVGNVELPGKADTVCPSCGTTVIKRLGMMVTANSLDDGKCPKCGKAIAGVWRRQDAWKRPTAMKTS